MKRILLTLLALVMLLTVVNVSVVAATTRPASDPVDVYTDGTATDDGEYVKAVGATTITIGNISATTSKLFYKVSGAATDTSVAISAAMREAGEYVIEGLTEGATYEIAVQWAADYSDRANIKIYQKSSYISVTTVSLQDGGKWPAPEGLGIDAGKLTGTETGKSYEYAPIDPQTFDASTATFTAYDEATTTLTGGLWAVRIAAGSDANYRYTESDAVVVYAKGNAVGTINYNTNMTGVFTPGQWTLKGVSTWGFNNNNAQPTGITCYVADATKDDFIQGSIIYQMTNDQIIPVTDFYSIKVDFENNGQGDAIVAPKPTPAKAIFYLYGGDSDTVEVPFNWSSVGGAVTIDLDSAVADDAKGYVWAIEFDICTTDEYSKNTEKSYHYISWIFPEATDTTNRIVTFPNRTAYPTPVLEAAGTDTDGVYEIKGFLPNYSYIMSTDYINFDDIDTSSGAIKVNATGKYYFRVKGDKHGYQSDVTTINIGGAMPAVSGLKYNQSTGSITGFDIYPDGVSGSAFIEYSKASFSGFAEWTTHGGAHDLNGLDAGLYAFRYRQRGNLLPGKVQYVYIKGANVGSISYDCAAGHDFVSGKWTSGSATGNAYLDGTRLASAQLSIEESDLFNLKWKYQMSNEEIISLAELGTFSFYIGYANACPYESDTYPATVKFYLVGAAQSYIEFDINAKNKTFVIIDIAKLWEDEVEADPNFVPDGYITGIEISYFDPDRSQNVNIINAAQNYPVLDFDGTKNTETKRVAIGAKKTVDMTSITPVRAIGTYGGELINLDPNGIYQWATYDEGEGEVTSDWTYVNPDSTYVNLPAGTYAIRTFFTADDPNYVSSDYVIHTILPALPGTENIQSAKAPKIVLPDAVSYADVNYVFDVDETRWISRLVISNILAETPDATITFKSEKYEIVVDAESIDLSLSKAHYFDMKVTFNGESLYDTEYAKMAALANENELVLGIHFESTTPLFFTECVFKVNVGVKYDGYSVDLRSYNKRVNFLKKEETVDVSGEWAEFTVFGGDYVVICPDFAADSAE